MTNPFLLELQDKGVYNPNSTGNPVLDQIYPHAGKDYDSIPWALGKSALGGMLSIVTGPAHWGEIAENYIKEHFPGTAQYGYPVFTKLAQLGDSLEPNLDPTTGFPTKAAVFATGMGAGMISGGLEFKGIGGALDIAATKLGGNAATRAATAIAKTAESVTIKARQLGLSEPIANTFGHAVRALPRNLATGLTMDAVNNPNQTGQGIATNSALIAGLSLMEGAMYRKIPGKLIPSVVDDPSIVGNTPANPNNDPDFLQRIKSKIGGIPEGNKDNPSLDKIYFNVVNRNRPFERLEKTAKEAGVELSTAQSPSAVSRMTNGAGPAIQKFNDAPFTYDENLTPVPQTDAQGNPIEGLKSIFSKVGDDPEKMKTLDAYILSKIVTDKADLGTYREKYIHPDTKEQATIVGTASGDHHIDYPSGPVTHPDLASAQADLKSNGYELRSKGEMPTPDKVTGGISIKDAIKTIAHIEENYPDIAEAHGKLMQYTQAVRNLAQSSGLLTQRGLDMFEILEKNHISLQSLMDGRIVSPSYSAIENTGTVVKASINNLVKDRILSLAENNPEAVKDWVKTEKIPDAKQTPMWQQVSKVVENLKNYGLDYADKEGVLELVTKMGPHFATPVDNDWSNIYSYKNGYVQRFSVNKDLSDALQAINPAHINLFTQLLGLPARALSVGTVENPIFGLVHAIRDSYNAMLNSKYGFRLGVDSWRGFKEVMGVGQYKGAMNAERLAAGGGYSTLVDARSLLDNSNLAKSVLPSDAGDKLLNSLIHPVQLLGNMTRPFLEAARVGEYMKAREAGATAFEAAMHSRSFIGDFGMKGASGVVQNLAYATAFMNPGMQSLDAEIKAISHHPIGYAAKGLGSIGLFTVLNYAYNAAMGDDDISKVRQTPEGSTYWYTKLPGGKILKTPKPFAPGQLFGTLLEAAMDKVRGQNPDAFSQWAKSMAESAEVNIVPTSVMTAANLYANRDNFSGRPIIPTNLEGVDPQYQQTASTSNVSKAITSTVRSATLGKVNISPITMDYILRSTLGTAGSFGEYASGTVGNVKRGASEIPGISRFIAKYPTYATQPIEEFYNRANEMDTVVRTANHLYKSNQMDDFTDYINKNANKWAIAPVYAETKAQLNELRTALVTLENDKYISGDSKKEMRDYIIQQQITITDGVNKALRKVLD